MLERPKLGTKDLEFLETPVLQISFNRPRFTRVVLNSLRTVKPKRLYLFVDGPRKSHSADSVKVEACRELSKSIDWDCAVETFYPEKNLGCRDGVKSAIDWFFENEEEGIILEDDCVPTESFFTFCSELLSHYRNDQRIGLISGDNLLNGRSDVYEEDASYSFSKYTLIWGWATWRDRWKQYEDSFDKNEVDRVIQVAFSSKHVGQFWKRMIVDAYEGRLDTWDMIWSYSILKHQQLCICPKINMITNIGFGAEATHTTQAKDLFSFVLTNTGQELDLPIIHPSTIEDNQRLNHALETEHYRIDLWRAKKTGTLKAFRKQVRYRFQKLLERILTRSIVSSSSKQASWRRRLLDLESKSDSGSDVFYFRSDYPFRYSDPMRFSEMSKKFLLQRLLDFEGIEPLVLDFDADEGISTLFFSLRFPLGKQIVYQENTDKYKYLRNNVTSWDATNIKLLSLESGEASSISVKDLGIEENQKVDLLKCRYHKGLLSSKLLKDLNLDRVERIVVTFDQSDNMSSDFVQLVVTLKQWDYSIRIEKLYDTKERDSLFSSSSNDAEWLLVGRKMRNS